jgi:peptide/nickel transport system permease protein
VATTTVPTAPAVPDAIIRARSPLRDRVFRPLGTFFRALRRNRAGMAGFIGLLFYFLLITVGPLFVPFDSKVKIDQITAPSGSRLQLVTRPEDATKYRTLDDLTGKTVGVIDGTGGEDLLAPYGGKIKVDATRWRSGNGAAQAMQKLTDGKVDAVIMFSEAIKTTLKENPALGKVAVSNPTLGPAHILGTDTQGRDIFSHIVNGGASLIVTAILAGFFSTAIAVILGALAALLGGIADRVLTTTANFVLTIPGFPLLVVLASLIKLDSIVLLAALIGGLSWPVLMRAVRSQVLSLRERDYVEAAVALDLGLPHIILREILPNMSSFVAINFIFAITSAMYQQVGLIFLGMAPINDYTWGVMLYFGRTRGTLFSPDSASMVLAPVIAIALFQVSMVLFARALEEMSDPRLRAAR